MLQIPVEKPMAKDFKNMAKVAGISQGELFEHAFTLLVLMVQGKEKANGNKENN